MGASVVMAVAEVSGEHQGETVTIAEGQRVAGNHPLVARYPAAFYPSEDSSDTLEVVRERHGLEGPVTPQLVDPATGEELADESELVARMAEREATAGTPEPTAATASDPAAAADPDAEPAPRTRTRNRA